MARGSRTSSSPATTAAARPGSSSASRSSRSCTPAPAVSVRWRSAGGFHCVEHGDARDCHGPYRVDEQLGADDAHRLRAIPLGAMSDAVAVAMVDPGDAMALETLHARLGATVVAVRRARAARALLPRAALRHAAARSLHPDRARRHRSRRAGRRRSPQVAAGRRDRDAADAHARAAPPPRLVQAPLTHAVPTAVSYGAACERIDTATNREQIAETFVDYGKGRCDALVVFLIREGNANGLARLRRSAESTGAAVRGADAPARRHLGAADRAGLRNDLSRPVAEPGQADRGHAVGRARGRAAAGRGARRAGAREAARPSISSTRTRWAARRHRPSSRNCRILPHVRRPPTYG